MSYDDFKSAISTGLFCRSVTAFDKLGDLHEPAFANLVDRLSSYQPAAIAIADDAGEFSSLLPREIIRMTELAKQVARDVPIFVGCGHGVKLALEVAEAADAIGADGIILKLNFPTAASQEGLFEYVRSICKRTRMAVIVCNCATHQLAPQTVLRLADVCTNLIGLQDSCGDIASLRKVKLFLGERLLLIGGMPTHELYAEAFDAAGFTAYASDIFNFAPELALDFYHSLRGYDIERMDEHLKSFFVPFEAIAQRRASNAIPTLKAGLRLAGHDCGPVRAPLADLSDEECGLLAPIVDAALQSELLG